VWCRGGGGGGGAGVGGGGGGGGRGFFYFFCFLGFFFIFFFFFLFFILFIFFFCFFSFFIVFFASPNAAAADVPLFCRDQSATCNTCRRARMESRTARGVAPARGGARADWIAAEL